MAEVTVLKGDKILEATQSPNRFWRVLCAVTGFFGFFLVLPFVIATDCYHEGKPVWKNV